MKIVSPEYQILAISGQDDEWPFSYSNPDKLIEYAARICYKSEEKITEFSSVEMIEKLRKMQHLAMIEHSWEHRFIKDAMANAAGWLLFEGSLLRAQPTLGGLLVAGNRRMFEEWRYFDAAEIATPDVTDACLRSTKHNAHSHHMFAMSVKFVVDRGVTHELVRHRPPSYAQESTRWCDYGNKDIQFILPCWMKDQQEYGEHDYPYDYWLWHQHMQISEMYYKDFRRLGWTPQQARSVLPNSLKTEIVVTASWAEWQHIFNLRAIGATGKPHPQMKEVMDPLYEECKRRLPNVFK